MIGYCASWDWRKNTHLLCRFAIFRRIIPGMNGVRLVGILNVTPDSFSGDGIHDSAKSAATQAAEMFANGADYVDVGAEATNPWAKPISAEEEWARLEPVLSLLMPEYPGKLSIDTHHPETIAKIAALFGTDFIANDVTGMNNPKMREMVASHNLMCIISHLPPKFGTDIHKAHANAELDSMEEVLETLVRRIDGLLKLGLGLEKIILDPGIGFGKTMRLNWDLLQFPAAARDSGIENPVLIGYSHKRFLGENRFDVKPNLEAGRLAIDSGAAFLRIHDVAPHYTLAYGDRSILGIA